MPYFEIVGVGFDASTDKTDHRVLWVSAPNLQVLKTALIGCPYRYISDLEDSPMVARSLDYTLPDHASALRAQLLDYAKPADKVTADTPEQKLVDLLSELLDCQELNLDDMEDNTREVVQRANDYLADNYLR